MKAIKPLLLGSALLLGLGTVSAFAQGTPDASNLSTTVKAALDKDSALAGTNIVVQNDNGKIRLNGFVTTDDQYAEAYRVAIAVPGVQKVLDRVITTQTIGA